MKIPASPPTESIVVKIDKREQNPADVSPLPWEWATLPTGDYTCKGLESVVAIERKSLDDLIGCVGRERERFEREIQRLLAYPVRAIVAETTWAALEMAQWRGKVTSKQAIGSCLGWIAAGVPIVMAGTHERAGEHIAQLIYIAARRRWRESRALIGAVLESEAVTA